jgi:hypothetical protein
LATFGDATQIEMILIAKASKEGDITGIFATNLPNVNKIFKKILMKKSWSDCP